MSIHILWSCCSPYVILHTKLQEQQRFALVVFSTEMYLNSMYWHTNTAATHTCDVQLLLDCTV